MTPSVTFTSAPPGITAWFCPYCERATVTCYRCSNGSCGKDLTNVHLRQVEDGPPS